MADEFAVDHRLILAVYRQLAAEGLIEVRERGGVYVASTHLPTTDTPALSPKWLVDTFAEALVREVPPADLSEWLRRSLETLRLRAVVVSTTEDQVAGLARELREDFGLLAEGLTGASIDDAQLHPTAIRRADLLIATAAHIDLVTQLGRDLGKPVIAIDVRPDLVAGEWAMLLRQPVWAIVATPEFGEMLRRFFANVRGIENLHILVHGRDDLSVIPSGAPTYVTHRVREQLRPADIHGRILPAARTISPLSARQILDFIVRANIRALRALQEPELDTDDGARKSG